MLKERDYWPKTNSGILEDLSGKTNHLEEGQASKLEELISEFRDIFSDVPDLTTLTEYGVVLNEEKSIK